MPKKKRKNSLNPRLISIREPKKRFLIVCEGEKTEPCYFESFRLSNAEIVVDGAASNPSKLVDKAKRLSQEACNEGDMFEEIWCVFDRDSWTSQDFNNALEQCNLSNFKVAYSNECFELWYVLHYEFLQSGIPRSDYAKKLTRHMGRKYEKNSREMYSILQPRQAEAIKNAERLLQQYSPECPCEDNPSTKVHRLVIQLNKYVR